MKKDKARRENKYGSREEDETKEMRWKLYQKHKKGWVETRRRKNQQQTRNTTMRRDDNETKRVNKKRPDETRKYKSNIRGY